MPSVAPEFIKLTLPIRDHLVRLGAYTGLEAAKLATERIQRVMVGAIVPGRSRLFGELTIHVEPLFGHVAATQRS
jgi:hypothetical protein